MIRPLICYRTETDLKVTEIDDDQYPLMMYNSVCLANHRSILTFVMQSSVYIMISTYVSYRGLALDFNPINLSNESKSSSFTIMGHCRSGKTNEF